MTAYIGSLVSRLDNFNVVYPCEGRSTIVGQPEGLYDVLISLDHDRASPTVVFSFYHDLMGEIFIEKHFDYADFAQAQHARYVEYTLNKSFTDTFLKATNENAMRAGWKIEALQDFFADTIDGDAMFWQEFCRHFERIMKPVAFEMFRKAMGREALPALRNPG